MIARFRFFDLRAYLLTISAVLLSRVLFMLKTTFPDTDHDPLPLQGIHLNGMHIRDIFIAGWCFSYLLDFKGATVNRILNSVKRDLIASLAVGLFFHFLIRIFPEERLLFFSREYLVEFILTGSITGALLILLAALVEKPDNSRVTGALLLFFFYLCLGLIFGTEENGQPASFRLIVLSSLLLASSHTFLNIKVWAVPFLFILAFYSTADALLGIALEKGYFTTLSDEELLARAIERDRVLTSTLGVVLRENTEGKFKTKLFERQILAKDSELYSFVKEVFEGGKFSFPLPNVYTARPAAHSWWSGLFEKVPSRNNNIYFSGGVAGEGYFYTSILGEREAMPVEFRGRPKRDNADLDRDGRVDGQDLRQLMIDIQTLASPYRGDVTGDGYVDERDLYALARRLAIESGGRGTTEEVLTLIKMSTGPVPDVYETASVETTSKPYPYPSTQACSASETVAVETTDTAPVDFNGR